MENYCLIEVITFEDDKAPEVDVVVEGLTQEACEVVSQGREIVYKGKRKVRESHYVIKTLEEVQDLIGKVLEDDWFDGVNVPGWSAAPILLEQVELWADGDQLEHAQKFFDWVENEDLEPLRFKASRLLSKASENEKMFQAALRYLQEIRAYKQLVQLPN